MWKYFAAAALSVAVIGAAAIPADARHGRNQHRRVQRADTSERSSLRNKVDQVATRARRLYQEGRLSADHRDRTLVKLEGIWDLIRNEDRMTNSEYQHYMGRLNDVNQTLSEWAQADSRSGRVAGSRQRHRRR